MNVNLAGTRRTRKPSRCSHRSAGGARCRMLPSRSTAFDPGTETLCHYHAKIAAARREDEEITSALTGGLDNITSAESVRELLSRLMLLLAQGRISPRRAAVMAYIAGLILRTIVAIEKQEAAAGAGSPRNETSAPPQRIIWDIPGPARDMGADVPRSRAAGSS